MKYVVGQNRVTESYHVAVFDEAVVHSEVARSMRKSVPALDVLSAGFVHRVKAPEEDCGYRWVVTPNAKADSLNLGPQPKDEVLLNLFLVQGLTGLDLSNTLAYLAIERLKRVKG